MLPDQPERASRGIHTWPPLVKVVLWAVTVIASAAALMSAAWLVGVAPAEFFYRGRSLLLVIALGLLLVMLLTDRRPTTAYGIIVGEHWARQAVVGFALGASFYVFYCLVAVAVGALLWQPQLASPWQWAGALLASLTAIPVAAVQQVMFSGYLVSLLRDRHGRAVSVLVPSVIFALLGLLDSPTEISWNHLPHVTSMILICTLLSLVRLRHGGLPPSVGLLAGCIYVRRVIRKTMALAPGEAGALLNWFAPGNDPRQGWLFQLLVAAAVGCYWLHLARLGEAPPVFGSAVHSSFKRLFPLSSPFSLAPLDLWARALWQARFRVQLSYVPRLIVILGCSAVNTLLTLPERLIFPWMLRKKVRDPLFILGVHRSGTTHLHNMLALDPNLMAPKNYHVLNPYGCLTSGWLVTTLLGPLMSSKRPMDSVRMHVFSPQEEEFAICGMITQSAYWSWVFPTRVAEYDRFILGRDFTAREKRVWSRAMLLFLRKLTLWSRRTPVLKSPYNTGKLAMLRELFPHAKFVHIARHPHAVYASNMHLAREALVMYQLHDPDPRDNFCTRFLKNYRAQEDAYLEEAATVPQGNVAEVRFEDLERDPLGEIRRIYAQLGMEFTPLFERRLVRYLESTSEYKKNAFRPLPPAVVQAIDRAMAPFYRRWGYVGGEQPQVLELSANPGTAPRRAA